MATTKNLSEIVDRISTRNIELTNVDPQGINIDKKFMASVANTNGVDLSKYKVVAQGQFACNRMHVGRDKRLPIAINDGSQIIVSPAYDVFEIKDPTLVLPEYLMLYFKTQRFDKECWFYTDADVRGALVADSFYSMEIPVPNIEIQREIVSKYNTLQKREDILESENNLLMNFGENILAKELLTANDEDFQKRKLGDFFPIVTGKKDANYGSDRGAYTFYTCAKDPIRSPGYSFDSSSILLAGNGNFDLNWHIGKFEAYQRVYVLTPYQEDYLGILYFIIKRYKNDITGGAQGSVIQFLTKGMIEDYEVLLPGDGRMHEIAQQYNSLLTRITKNKEEIFTLRELKSNIFNYYKCKEMK